MPRITVAGDICLRKSRHTEGYRADDNDLNLILYKIKYTCIIVTVLIVSESVTSNRAAYAVYLLCTN
jgi:hypothetical protein